MYVSQLQVLYIGGWKGKGGELRRRGREGKREEGREGERGGGGGGGEACLTAAVNHGPSQSDMCTYVCTFLMIVCFTRHS